LWLLRRAAKTLALSALWQCAACGSLALLCAADANFVAPVAWVPSSLRRCQRDLVLNGALQYHGVQLLGGFWLPAYLRRNCAASSNPTKDPLCGSKVLNEMKAPYIVANGTWHY